LADPLGGHQPGAGERLEVAGRGRLFDAELVGDEQHADAVVDQVAVLLREVRPGVLQPLEDLEAPGARQRRERAEIGRPSLLQARADGTADEVRRVRVGGSAVIVARGDFRVD
jgi:hypothetical protein